MSEKWPHLSKAPITEAIIDFQFADTENIEFDNIKSLEEILVKDFPEIQPKRISKITTMISPAGPVTEISDEGFHGIVCSSEDNIKVIQILTDRFALSYLKPYSNWIEFESDVLGYWQIVQKKLSISALKRIGVRFINKIEMDLPVLDFNDYFRSIPQIDPELPQSLLGFHQQFAFQFPDKNSLAIVALNFENIDQTKQVANMLLDIDVGYTGLMDTGAARLKKILSELRDYKNLIFYKMITQKVVEKYI